MNRLVFCIVCISLLGFVSIACGCARETHIILVRHAEKVVGNGADPHDPSLREPEGPARAQALKDVMDGMKLGHVFSTDFIRTRETAAPVATAAGLSVELYSNDTLDAFCERLLSVRRGDVLVVGHSNTIGQVANNLMRFVPDAPVTGLIPDDNYDTLLIVTVMRRALHKNWIFHMRYGDESPPPQK